MSSDPKSWREVQESIERIATNALKTSDRDYTDLDYIRAEFTYLAEQVGKVMEAGNDRLYTAALKLAEAQADPERVHGELVFDPRALSPDGAEDYELPLGGDEWHPRGTVPMTRTQLPVIVPEPDPGIDGYGNRAHCRHVVETMLSYHFHLRFERMLPEDPEPAEVAA